VEKLSNLAVISSFTLAPHYEGIAAHPCRRSHLRPARKSRSHEALAKVDQLLEIKQNSQILFGERAP
jgi:hypothetical protein